MDNKDLTNQLILKLEEEGFGNCKDNHRLFSFMFSKKISETRVVTFSIYGDENLVTLKETNSIGEFEAFSISLKFRKKNTYNIIKYMSQILDSFCEYKSTEQDVGVIVFKLYADLNGIVFEEINGKEKRMVVFYEDGNGKHYLFLNRNGSINITTTASYK